MISYRDFFEFVKMGFQKKILRSRPCFQGYDLEQEIYSDMQMLRRHTMLTYARLVTLYQEAVFCEKSGIYGDFIECGTWKGGAVALMALANLRHGSNLRHIHLFDSFEGIPEPDESIDGEKAIQEIKRAGGEAKGRLVSVRGFYDRYGGEIGTLEQNRHLLETVIGYASSHLHYHKGWFQDTLPKDSPEIREIAILRLDGDWYASTKICLEHLYDKVVKGGFVIIDDYGYFEGCRKAVDEFIKKKGYRVYLNHIDATGRYWIKP